MKNHPAAVERYKYLEGEAAKCRSLQPRSQPAPEAIVTKPVDGSSPTSGSSAELLWKLTGNPNSHWKFTFGEQFLYGEHMLPEERRKLGDFDTVDVKKQGDVYVGVQRVRRAFKLRDASPEGFHYNVCQWTFAVELTIATDERIEGRWEGYPPGTQVNPANCERSGDRTWQDVAWIRE